MTANYERVVEYQADEVIKVHTLASRLRLAENDSNDEITRLQGLVNNLEQQEAARKAQST